MAPCSSDSNHIDPVVIAPDKSTPDTLDHPLTKTRWFVPGRLEVFGKHTDYAGGHSLLGAVDRGHTITATRRDDDIVTLTSSAFPGKTLRLPISTDVHADSWGTYAATVIRRLALNFPDEIHGADITMDSTLPLASGMSSSSAMIVGLTRALLDLTSVASWGQFRRNIQSYEDLAGYMSCIENGMTFGEFHGTGGVGTFGGSEDHTAMLCCKADALSEYSFAPVNHIQDIAFPADYQFVIAVSGVLAEKTGKAKDDYNRISQTVADLLQRWNKHTDRHDMSLMAALTSSSDAPAQLRHLAGDDTYMRRRLDQFIDESLHIVPTAAEALAHNRLDEWGELAEQSQQGALEGLGNQVEHTHDLTLMARSHGAIAASAFGAGFGGAVWALLPREDAKDFAASWKDTYTKKYGDMQGRSHFFPVNLSGRAQRSLAER